MSLPRLWQDLTSDPFSAPNIRTGTPAINVAETKDAFEVTVELPGVDEKDVEVSLDSDRLVISGEKKAERMAEEKDWHVEERSLGSFYRSISLPFEPENGALDAYFDKGVLHLTIKKTPIGTRSGLYWQC
jgi:HSP20 family protein